MTPEAKMELVGASQQAIPIGRTGASASVKLDAGVRRKVSASLAQASETAPARGTVTEIVSETYERNAFAPDRSSELIYEWDSIHLDGVSWHSSGGESLTCAIGFLRIRGVLQELHRSTT